MRYEDWSRKQGNPLPPVASSVQPGCAKECHHTLVERKRMQIEGLSHSQIMEWRARAHASAVVACERRPNGGQKDILESGCAHYWYDSDKCMDCGDDGLA